MTCYYCALCITEICPLPKDHCDMCSGSLRYKHKCVYNMGQSKQFLEIYDALSSPAYLFTQTGIDAKSGFTDMDFVDPIQEVFILSGKMRLMQRRDPSFKVYHYYLFLHSSFSVNIGKDKLCLSV